MTERDEPQQVELRRSLNRFDATMIVMGTIIGIGIFFTPSRVAGAVGSPWIALLAWGLGGVIAFCGASTYAALGQTLPHTGGPYVYLREGLGRFPAFLYGYIVLTAIMTGAVAVIGVVFVDYLAWFFDMGAVTKLVVAAAVILGLTVVNVVGVVWGSRVQNVFTVLKIASLLGLVVVGLWKGGTSFDVVATRAADAPGPLTGFVSALVGVLFSFGGWQNLTNVAGEMKDPDRDLPRAILVGVVGVATVYLLANVAYLRLLPIDALVASNVPAAAALEQAIGPRAGDVTALLILCSAFGILNGLTLAGPRIYYAMAKDGLLPRAFGRVHATFRTPVAAIVAQGAIATALLVVFGGEVGPLTDYVVFADWLFFTLTALSLFALVAKGRTSVRALGYPIVPGLFALLSAAVTVGILIAQWENASKGLAILGVGAALYFLFGRRRAAQ